MENQYKIVGGDGLEYGPATLPELIEWIRDGRMCRTTQTWRSDTGSWQLADEYAELAEALAAQPQPTSPPAFSVAAPDALPPVEMAEAFPVGFWARLAAYILDTVVLTFLFQLLWPAISSLTGWETPRVPSMEANQDVTVFFRESMKLLLENSAQFIPYIIAIQVEQMAYHVLFTGSCGATPGKLVIGARIVREDGTRIGYGQAFFRWLATRLSDFLFGVGYLFIAVRPDKRGLHDLLVGTKVIFKR
jgi:uncharacterized RDD family membrane protein YckC